MPQHAGDVGNKLNLWRGFRGGVEQRGAKGCERFSAFAHEVICSGNGHYRYLMKGEAHILQNRTRSEVALGMRSDEEAVGKASTKRRCGIWSVPTAYN